MGKGEGERGRPQSGWSSTVGALEGCVMRGVVSLSAVGFLLCILTSLSLKVSSVN